MKTRSIYLAMVLALFIPWVHAADEGANFETIRIGDMLMDRTTEKGSSDYIIKPWVGGKIAVKFPSSLDPAKKRMFFEACALWTAVSRLYCTERVDEVNYVVLKLKPAGCFASLGAGWFPMPKMRKRIMNLAPGCWTRGIIAHEIGHLMGFIHEHQRSDRDGYIKVHRKNVIFATLPNFFRMPTARTLTPYDFLSIMHYPKWAFSKNRSDTITPQPGYEGYLNLMGQRISLSPGDALAARRLY